MRGPIRVILLAALAVCGLVAAVASQASAATLGQPGNLAFLAIYGSPGANGTAASTPVGGGLGRNFGFGENMVFNACTGCATPVGANLKFKLGGSITEANDTYIGGTLMSNKTGEGNALGFAMQFVDFGDPTLGGVTDPWYTDTSDRPWISDICGVSEGTKTKECRIDPLFTEAEQAGNTVKIEDVSLNMGPGVVLQGTLWGKWLNGKAKEAPCIELKLPSAKVKERAPDETLSATQPVSDLGASIEEISGKACLIGANNDWYKVGANLQEPAITIKNE